MYLHQAIFEINSILQQLEQSTGSVVESISLNRVDATRITDVSTVYLATVDIELKRMPSQNWSV